MTAGLPGSVVIDTSVFVSAEIFSTKPSSPAREALARSFARHFDTAVSDLLLREIARKLLELGFDEAGVADYLAKIRAVATCFPDEDPTGLTCDDEEDLFVLALARTCQAWFVVAQDNALSRQRPLGCTPGFFLARLREARGEPEGHRFP